MTTWADFTIDEDVTEFLPDNSPPLPTGTINQGARDINFAACKSVSIFEKLFDIEFHKVHFARYIEELGFGEFNSVHSGDLNFSRITLGDRTPDTPDVTDAVVDVVGHELAHGYQNSMQGNNASPKERALYEGLADIYGTYVELDFNTNFDWKMGELGRDLSNYVAWDSGAGPYHQAQTVGHWFYLCHEGSSQFPFPIIDKFDSETLRVIIDDAFLYMHGNLSIDKFAQFTRDDRLI